MLKTNNSKIMLQNLGMVESPYFLFIFFAPHDQKLNVRFDIIHFLLIRCYYGGDIGSKIFYSSKIEQIPGHVVSK